jgi:hypothetical protein
VVGVPWAERSAVTLLDGASVEVPRGVVQRLEVALSEGAAGDADAQCTCCTCACGSPILLDNLGPQVNPRENTRNHRAALWSCTPLRC